MIDNRIDGSTPIADLTVSEALSASREQQRWRAVLEATDQGVWDWDVRTNQVYFSSAWKRMLGFEDDEIGNSLEERDSRLHPDDREQVYADLKAHFSGQTANYQNTHRVRCKNGEYKWILDRGRVFSRDDKGEPLRVVGTHTDVSDNYEFQHRIKELSDNVPGMLYQFRLDADGNSSFPFVSSGSVDIYGFTAEQLATSAEKIYQNMHSDDFESVSESILQSAKNLSVWEKVYRYYHPKFGLRWLSGRATPVKQADGSTQWNGYIYDITLQKSYQNELEDTRLRHQLTMEASRTGLWTWDLISNKVEWSSMAYRQLGHEPNAFPMSRNKFRELMNRDDFERVMPIIQKDLTNRDGFDVQFRLQHADGHCVWIQGRGQVVEFNSQNHPIKMMGTHFDITEQKNIENRLESERNRLELATKSAGLGIWDYDIANDHLEWDAGMFKLYGMPHEQFRHSLSDWQNTLWSEQREQAIIQFQDAIEQGNEMDATFAIQHQLDGTKRTLHVQAKIIRDKDRNPIRIVGVNRDISQQQDAQIALKAAKLEAERANQEKSNFLANMSHEIRTPMSNIIGLSQISQDESDITLVKQQLKRMHTSGRYLLSVLNDILDFSKIEAGKVEFAEQPFLLTVLLDNLVSLFSDAAKTKGISLELDIDDQLYDAYYGDEVRLQQVLTNLMGNAVKFTDAGSICVLVKVVEIISPDKQLISFSVSDTGIGISPQQQSRLFKSFSQANDSVSRQYGGSGLGLVISQRLVEGMGASGIELRSTVGEGSVFSFVLTLRTCTDKQRSALIDVTKEGADRDYRLTGRVLVVDDNSINLDITRAYLEKVGLQVDSVSNAKSAISKAKDVDYQLILMDIQMPEMDGYQATVRLRENGYSKPIIALTAAVMIEDQKKAKAASMDAHLTKPIIPERLYQTIAPYVAESSRLTVIEEASVNAGQGKLYSDARLDFDVEKAMQQSGLDRNLYSSLLSDFTSQFHTQLEQLPGQLRELKDTTRAQVFNSRQRQLHSIKGVAGNLRLSALYNITKQLDALLKNAEVPNDDLITQFEASAIATLTNITMWVREHRTEENTTERVHDSQGKPTTELAELLSGIKEQRFYDDEELRHMESLIEGADQLMWREVLTAVRNFEFDIAEQKTTQLIARMSDKRQ